MAKVNFPTTYGGDGLNYTDDSDPQTGMGNGGFRTRLLPLLQNIIAACSWIVTQVAIVAQNSTNAQTAAASAALSATTALNAPGTSATSTTSLTIGVGNQVLTVQAGKLFSVGMYVTIASTAAPANVMSGVVTAYNSATGAMTVSVTITSGDGTVAAAWTIAISGPPNSSSALPTLYVQDQKGTNASGGTSVAGNNTRVLNTVVQNTIPGASLSGGAISLPPGSYKVRGSAPFYTCGANQAYIGTSTGAVLALGTSESGIQTVTGRSVVVGFFTLGATSTLWLYHRTTTAAVNGLGVPSGGTKEIYTEVEFTKVG